MTNKKPTVSIGLPVYNGDNFLAEAVESVLAQTYEDFELIISDNASTDRTEEISRRFAERDARVKYVRNEENLGASRNYNQLVEMAEGQYFKWIAHDDLCAPEFVEKCAAVLDENPDVVICFPMTQGIDSNGEFIREYNKSIEAESPEPWKRFYQVACQRHNLTASITFGLMRTDILRRTHMIGAFSSSDRTLVGEMALYGGIQMIPEVLFYKRDHAEAHWIQYSTRQQRMAWYDTSKKAERTYPHWRLLQEHIVSIHNAPLSRTDRLLCYATLTKWVRNNVRVLALNLVQKDVGQRKVNPLMAEA